MKPEGHEWIACLAAGAGVGAAYFALASRNEGGRVRRQGRLSIAFQSLGLAPCIYLVATLIGTVPLFIRPMQLGGLAFERSLPALVVLTGVMLVYVGFLIHYVLALAGRQSASLVPTAKLCLVIQLGALCFHLFMIVADVRRWTRHDILEVAAQICGDLAVVVTMVFVLMKYRKAAPSPATG
jgi:hypothetical protein